MSTDRPRERDRCAPRAELKESLRLAAAGRAAVAQNLARLYDEVLEAPLPAELTALVRRLESRERELR